MQYALLTQLTLHYLNTFFFFQLWKLPFAQVIFDSDPALTGTAETLHVDDMSQAMIRYVMYY